MKRLAVLVTLALLVAGLVLFGLNDTVISIVDTRPPENEVRGSVSKASNSSASATIIITMRGVVDE